jgi:transporter family-2 protein
MALAFAVGCLAAAQSRINGQLAIEVQDGLLAAAISFGTGLVLVLVIALSRGGSRAALLSGLPHQLRTGGLRWWHLVGGLLGASFVAGQGLVVPLVGVALFTVLSVAGNTSSSIATDRLGLGPGGRRPVTTGRVLAALGAVLGVAVAVSGRMGAGDLVAWAIVLAVLAGAGTGVQPALNGQIAARTGEPLVATVVNFVTGTAALLVALSVEHALGHGWRSPPAPWEQPLLWIGGAIGVVFILTASVVVRPLGLLLLSLLSTAGQLTGALVLDVLVPTPGTVVTWQLLAGVLITGVAVASAAWRRSPKSIAR